MTAPEQSSSLTVLVVRLSVFHKPSQASPVSTDLQRVRVHLGVTRGLSVAVALPKGPDKHCRKHVPDSDADAREVPAHRGRLSLRLTARGHWAAGRASTLSAP